ncbi:hypothetical protein [Truepera radiovictrix]|uniref:Uncharacterized protein n=1 Tax=Truepera radiovictrix (strain DSM 17093 / CIP 108686 / LMG 22925 / RQ-24) TaxID=649638 RepID=D7CVK0_TRURR|nr:hypothetical protein [Truepera radiovictrix]ADI15911.1 hypothetical protein Trad_2810 [Truepera radiovictrix DSM 17093]WMT58462.1 hypothetical protein RCV51_05835 [Truepera radiovictrix]
MPRRRPPQLIDRALGAFIGFLGWLLLAFFLACTAVGAFELFVLGSARGLGLLALGVALYFGARLAFDTASDAV